VSGKDTVIYLSLNAFGFVVEEEGREFVTLKTKVEGSDNFKSSVDSSRTLNAAPMTGHAKLKCESLIISYRTFFFSLSLRYQSQYVGYYLMTDELWVLSTALGPFSVV
jgi:hypothetical protein